jgi:hypothetical protein
MAPPRDNTPWQDHPPSPDRDELLAPSTQVVADRDAYLGQGRHDVGRRISNDQVELFATGDVASALQLEFSQHAPQYVAVHDVGTSAGLRLLASLASATGQRLQSLTVRRQGHGVAMAVLQFVEVRLADGTPVRVYATDLGNEGPLRLPVAKVLLAYSQLGVLLMGGLAPTTLAAQLQPLQAAVQAGPWPNRELLMLPLGSGLPLASHATQLAGASGVAVHVTPHAGKTRQAWAYIAGAWNRLHGGAAAGHAMQAEFGPPGAPPPPIPVPRSEAPTEAMGLNPFGDVPTPARAYPHPNAQAAAHAPTVNPWQAYVDSCGLLKGAIACCAFDTLSMHPLAHTGPAPQAAKLAEQGAKLLKAMTEATQAVGLSAVPTDGSVTAAGHHLLVRPVPDHPGIAVHLVLSGSANLTLAKMQLERIHPPR